MSTEVFRLYYPVVCVHSRVKCFIGCYFYAERILENTWKSHSCFSIVSCLGKHLGREINAFYERKHKLSPLSLTRTEGAGYFLSADSLKNTCSVTQARRRFPKTASEELWKTSCERSLENWNPLALFATICKSMGQSEKKDQTSKDLHFWACFP